MADGTLNSYDRAMLPLRIHVLVLRDCTVLVPIGLADMLRKSAELASSLPARRARRGVEITLVSATRQRTVVGTGGIGVRCDAVIEESPRATWCSCRLSIP
jgi:hypothetical protein